MTGKADASESLRAMLSGRLSRREIARRAAATGLAYSAVAAWSSAGGNAAAQGEGEPTPGGEIVVGLNLEPDNLIQP